MTVFVDTSISILDMQKPLVQYGNLNVNEWAFFHGEGHRKEFD